MGVSRSATIIIAYLLWHSRQSLTINKQNQSTTGTDSDMVPLPPTPLSVESALALLREGRPRVEPNSGFIKQLRMYVEMGCPTTQSELENHKIYRRWMNSRNVMDALSVNRAPELEHITWRDEEEDDEEDERSGDDARQQRRREAKEELPDPEITDPMIATSDPAISDTTTATSSIPREVDIKCRKCRRLIAKSNFIIRHLPPPHRDPTNSEACAHIFLHPLSWMKSTLSEGALDGRLTCPNPKCGANIGKFAWQGLRCSCGGWVTPGFGVGRGKVDEVPVRKGMLTTTSAAKGSQNNGAGTVSGLAESTAGLSLRQQQQHQHQHHPAVRLPPGMKRAASGNL